jgi:cytoplasmic iron level regulating protein YaaA (DUF328/UPF0246 family)
MLTVLSPAKTLDYETPLPISKSTKPLFAAKSAELIDLLREYSPKQLAKLMSISDKLATLNVERYEAWEPKATKSNARQAILAFKGDVYQGLDAWSFKQADFDFAQDHLRMLSGLYGALRPLDLMQPYRLEMGTRLKNDQGKDLYDFWDDTITLELNKQLKKNGDTVLLNLASNEYFKSVQVDRLKADVIAPVFKDQKNGKYKIISFFAKKARGIMSGWIIRKKITDPKKLIKFAEAGYYYCPEESTDKNPVFYRDEK